MSEAVVAIDAVAMLLAVFPSLVAPVTPVSVLVPTAVGVPETLQVMAAPAATLTGGVGAHDVVKPAGSPATEQVAPVAAIRGAAPLEQVNVPL